MGEAGKPTKCPCCPGKELEEMSDEPQYIENRIKALEKKITSLSASINEMREAHNLY